jgi:hypothetical protein
MKTKGIDEFSDRLDEIFDQGNPTKAQILDAYNKAVEHAQQASQSDDSDISDKQCESCDEPIPCNLECDSDVSKEEIMVYFNNHTNGYSTALWPVSKMPPIPVMNRSAVLEFAKWYKSRLKQSTPDVGQISDEEIDKWAGQMPYRSKLNHEGRVEGAKWYRSQYYSQFASQQASLPSDKINEATLIRLIRFAQEGHIYTRGDFGSKAFTFKNGEPEDVLITFKKKHPKIKWIKSSSQRAIVFPSDEDIKNAANEYAKEYGMNLYGDYFKAYKKGATEMRDGKIYTSPKS